MDQELLPGSGSGTQKIQSWIWNKSFRIHNTGKNTKHSEKLQHQVSKMDPLLIAAVTADMGVNHLICIRTSAHAYTVDSTKRPLVSQKVQFFLCIYHSWAQRKLSPLNILLTINGPLLF